MRRVEVRSKTGIYLGHRTAFLWPVDVHNSVMERIARGLYYHHFDDILGARAICDVTWLNRLDKDFLEASAHWPQIELGHSAVIYRYARASEFPLSSAWVFQFYKRHWVMVETKPVERPNNRLEADAQCQQA